jgi:hypothetical protein
MWEWLLRVCMAPMTNVGPGMQLERKTSFFPPIGGLQKVR